MYVIFHNIIYIKPIFICLTNESNTTQLHSNSYYIMADVNHIVL